MSKESLTGFDMVWAITQNTVNSQLAWLQDCGLIPNKVRIGDLEADGICVGGTGDDVAYIAAPTVDFDTGLAKTAKLILDFTGGNVQYYSGFGKLAEVKKQSLAGWRLVFNVMLNVGQIGHDYLVHGDCRIPDEIKNLLTQFDPSMFSIQSIFMDFQNSDLTTYSTIESVIKTDNEFVKQNFATSVGAWINSHKGQDNPFILGYPVTRNSPPQDTPSLLEPTGANLSAHSYKYPPETKPEDMTKNGLSTLNFLLVTGDRKILDEPALYSAAAGTFDRNLVESNDIDGKGIVAREVFFDKYLYNILVKPFEDKANSLENYVHHRDDRDPNVGGERSGVDAGNLREQRARFVPTATGWEYKDNIDLSWHESGSNSHDRESQQHLGYTIDMSMQPDSSGGPRLTMDIKGSLYRYEWDQVNQDMPFKNNVYMGKGWGSSSMSWEIRLQFVAGTDGKITITKTSKQNDPVEDSGTGGIYEFADFFRNLFGAHSIADDWRDNAANLGNIERDLVQQLVDGVGPIIDNAMTRIVMPARTQFFYKNLLLNADGDIEIDFTYKSEVQ